MIIFPAIDLYDKKAVRLFKGDYNKMTVYSENPLEVAKGFKAQGAEYIHMVDLEGAKDGTTPNFDVVAAVAQHSGLKVEIGGGIRDEETVKRYIDAGVMRVILGTAAVNDREFLEKVCEKYADKIAVGADLKDGRVAVKGWLEDSGVSGMDFLFEMQKLGVKTVICTDISRDGAMQGTNRELYKELSEKFTMDIVASGGVSTIEDIEALGKMITKRIIPCLDVKNGRVVKGVNFEGLSDVSSPVELAKKYWECGADELVFYDITASFEGRKLFTDVLREVASTIFIPLTVGGGINTVEDFDRVLKCGADKVSVNSGAIRNPDLIREAAQIYGNQCVVLSVDIKRVDGEFHVFAKGGREDTGIEAIEWIKSGVKRGAGEIVVNSIDTDGVKQGFDIEMLKAVQNVVNVPVIASGGAGKIEDFVTLFNEIPKMSAGLAASIFHFGEVAIPDLKEELYKNNIPVRRV